MHFICITNILLSEWPGNMQGGRGNIGNRAAQRILALLELEGRAAYGMMELAIMWKLEDHPR